MSKPEIRKQMKGLNTGLSGAERERLSAQIFRQTEQLPAFREAHVVAVFSSLPDEPRSEEALARWAAAGKRVVVPRVEGEAMRFYDYSGSAMSEGAFGILEPAAEALCPPDGIDLIVVPGVAFTARGMRLGRGKGFYDKYLSQSGFRAFKAGVCYPHQVVDELPAEEHDRPVDRVCCGE